MAPFLWASTWTRVLLGGSLWISVLWVLLCPVCCSQGPPKWRFTTSEVVIPRKVPQRMGGSDRPDQLAYSMRFRGQRHVVHMKLKKNMIPENLPVYTTNDQGAEQEDYPFVPRDCYFYSYLEGVPGSLATLDTCNGGLNGMLQVDDFTYEIKPLASSSKFEHVISLLVVEGFQKSKKCTNEDNVVEADEFLKEMELTGSPRAAPVYLWRVHMRLVRMFYTVTVEVTRLIQNYTASLELILIMNNIADSIYKQAGLTVYPYIIQIWETHNGLDINQWQNDPQQIMSQFGSYRNTEYEGRDMQPTTYALLAGIKYGGLDYAVMQNRACSRTKGVIIVYVTALHKFLSATLLCHTLGHSLGLHHDTPGCVCFRRSSCVMNEFPALMDMMSNCSQADLHNIVSKVENCLTYPHVQFHRAERYEVPRCGDNKVSDSEQCDCGSLKECVNNSCCTTNCRFTPGSSCDVGRCCQQCSFAPAGTMCRDKLGICDLPEYCDGNTNNCPRNFYIQDGTPCSPLAVCMSGNCSDRDLQCQALFGYQVKDAKPACYQQLNTKGDRFGNCGEKLIRIGSRLHACEDDDIYCGLLHCDGVIRVPGGGEHTTFHHIRIQDIKEEYCFGYDVHHGTGVPNMGLVVDGATCGPGKYCRAQSCVFHQNLNFTCDVAACNHRGVCNNRGHCHCVHGWQPPNCEEEGSGGSVDSGPVPTSEEMLRAKIRVNINKILVVLCTRMILVLASLFFGGISKAVIFLDSRRRAPRE